MCNRLISLHYSFNITAIFDTMRVVSVLSERHKRDVACSVILLSFSNVLTECMYWRQLRRSIKRRHWMSEAFCSIHTFIM
jgi:hypothetical protein